MISDAPKSDAPAPDVRRSRTLAFVAVGFVVAVFALAVGVALAQTSKPAFYAGYSAYARSVSTMETSGHKDLACTDCHESGNPVLFGAGLVGDFYAGLRGKGDLPSWSRLGPPTREKCLKCHSEAWSDEAARTNKVPHPAHLRVAEETRDCIVCHRWVAHEETYMQQHKKMPYSTVCASYPCHVGYKQASDCKNCHHQLQQSLDVWKAEHPKVVAAVGVDSCLEKCHSADQCETCHTTGQAPKFANVIAPSTVTTIEVAHVKKDWMTQHGTFALLDTSKCLTCHVTQQECKDCHSKRPAFHGTDTTAWIGTHKNFAKDKRRCLACHENAWCEDCHKQFKEMR